MNENWYVVTDIINIYTLFQINKALKSIVYIQLFDKSNWLG